MSAVVADKMFAHLGDGDIQMSGYPPSVVILFWDLFDSMVLTQFFRSKMTDGVGLAIGAGWAQEDMPERETREHQTNGIGPNLDLGEGPHVKRVDASRSRQVPANNTGNHERNKREGKVFIHCHYFRS
jgi:hypothetical protein